jgi:hypothetical protein
MLSSWDAFSLSSDIGLALVFCQSLFFTFVSASDLGLGCFNVRASLRLCHALSLRQQCRDCVHHALPSGADR